MYLVTIIIIITIHTNRAPQYLADCVQTLDLDPPTQLPTWSRVQEPSSETAAFAPLHLPRGTVSQTSSTVLLYSSREHIVTNFCQRSWAAFVNGAIQIFLLLLLLLLFIMVSALVRKKTPPCSMKENRTHHVHSASYSWKPSSLSPALRHHCSMIWCMT